MKKYALILILLLCLPRTGQSTEAEKVLSPEDAPKSLMDETFVVETSENDMNDSLNRISGGADRGFADEEYTYKSKNHGAAGPMERQKNFENSY